MLSDEQWAVLGPLARYAGPKANATAGSAPHGERHLVAAPEWSQVARRAR